MIYLKEPGKPLQAQAGFGEPEHWTSEQIADFQRWFDDMLNGLRRGQKDIQFLPDNPDSSSPPLEEYQVFRAHSGEMVVFKKSSDTLVIGEMNEAIYFKANSLNLTREWRGLATDSVTAWQAASEQQ